MKSAGAEKTDSISGKKSRGLGTDSETQTESRALFPSEK